MAINPVLDEISNHLGRQSPDRDSLEDRFAALKSNASPPVPPVITNYRQFFLEQARRNLFEITECHSTSEPMLALRSHHLPVVLSPQDSIRTMAWEPLEHKLTDDFHSPALGVVQAVAAIAETGTLVVRSSDVPSALLFLSEELVIILRENLIVPFQEDLWQRFPHQPGRAIHLISGPSRTADVEQTLQVGAHGPRRVHLWLVIES